MENVFCIVDKSFKFLTLSVSQYTVWDYPGLDGEQSIMVCVACKGIKHTKFWFVRWNQKKNITRAWQKSQNIVQHVNSNANKTRLTYRKMNKSKKNTRVKKCVFMAHICASYQKWSFRRFTYGNLVTTSPSSK